MEVDTFNPDLYPLFSFLFSPCQTRLGSNMVSSTWNFNQFFEIWASAQFALGIGGSTTRFKFIDIDIHNFILINSAPSFLNYKI